MQRFYRRLTYFPRCFEVRLAYAQRYYAVYLLRNIEEFSYARRLHVYCVFVQQLVVIFCIHGEIIPLSSVCSSVMAMPFSLYALSWKCVAVDVTASMAASLADTNCEISRILLPVTETIMSYAPDISRTDSTSSYSAISRAISSYPLCDCGVTLSSISAVTALGSTAASSIIEV